MTSPLLRSREIADLMLVWRDGFAHDAARNDLSVADYERRAVAACIAARRCAYEACTAADPDTGLKLLSAAGRYALSAQVSRARAKELGGK